MSCSSLPSLTVSVQEKDFDHAELYQQLREHETSYGKSGAIATFCGLVREFTPLEPHKSNDNKRPEKEDSILTLQHYPGMTEKVLYALCEQAQQRWDLHAATIVHRVGKLQSGEQIVFVGVSAAHRKSAFQACEYIMDILKTTAPFWKKEGEHWVEAKESDEAAATEWTTRLSANGHSVSK